MSDCTHYYKIEAPNGTSFVEGECKHCGDKRTFKVDATKWKFGKVGLLPARKESHVPM